MEHSRGGADGGGESVKQGKEVRVGQLKEQVERGDYRVDPKAVAEAMVRRLRELGLASGPHPETHSECSYPSSGWSVSANTTSPSPSRTEPIQVSPPISLALARLLTTFGATQTQSS
jgi:Anti-sigma-28 factor, FlgM